MKSVLGFASLLMIFFALRIGLNFYNYNREEVLVANNFNQKILLVKSRGKAIFYIGDDSKPEQIQKFLVEPYLSSRRISKYEIKTYPKNTGKVLVNGKVYELNR